MSQQQQQQQTSLTDFFNSRRRGGDSASMSAKRLKVRGYEGNGAGYNFSGGGSDSDSPDDNDEKNMFAKNLSSEVVVFSGAAVAAASTTTKKKSGAIVGKNRRPSRTTTTATRVGGVRRNGRTDVATSAQDDHGDGRRRQRAVVVKEVEEVVRRKKTQEVEVVGKVAISTRSTVASSSRQLRAERGDGRGDERRAVDKVEVGNEEVVEEVGKVAITTTVASSGRQLRAARREETDGGRGDERRAVDEVEAGKKKVVETAAAITTTTTPSRRRRLAAEKQERRGENGEEVNGDGESPGKRPRGTETPCAAGDETVRRPGQAVRKRLQLGENEHTSDVDDVAGNGGNVAGNVDDPSGAVDDGDNPGIPVATNPTSVSDSPSGASLRKSAKEKLNRRLSLSPACGGPQQPPRGPLTPQKGGATATPGGSKEANLSLGTCSSLAELQAKILRLRQQQKKREEEQQGDNRRELSGDKREASEPLTGAPGKTPSTLGAARNLDSSELKLAVERARAARDLVSRLRGSPAPATPPPTTSSATSTATSFDLDLPHSTDSGENVPAFERFHTLAQDAAPGLALPLKMTQLADMFRAMDTAVSMLFNRAETATFARVRGAVREILRRHFEERHAGQIHAVLPEAFRFRQEKVSPSWSHAARPGDYQLTVEPVLPAGDTNQGSRPQLTAARLLQRRRSFHAQLLTIVKKHHKAFLESLSPPMVVPEERLTRWHPRFNVDAVPEVAPAPLPQPPHTALCTTASDALRLARAGGGGGLTPKMEKALANVALRSAGASPRDGVSQEETGETRETGVTQPVMPLSPALKGIPQSLIDRVRAREAAHVTAAMQRRPEREERHLRLLRLPAVARLLRGVFLAERRPALPLELACARLVQSCGHGTSAGEMEHLLRLLAESLPDWLSVVVIGRGDAYVKLLDKSADLGRVAERLRQITSREEEQEAEQAR